MLPKRTPVTSSTDEVLTVVAQGRFPAFKPASVPPPAPPSRARMIELDSEEDDCEVTRMMPSKAFDSVPPPAAMARPLQTRVHLPRRERAIAAPPPPPPPPSSSAALNPAFDTLRPVAAPTADQIEAHMNVIRAERMMNGRVAYRADVSSTPAAVLNSGNTVVLDRGRRSMGTWGVAVGAMAVFGALLVAVVTGGVGSVRGSQMAAAASMPMQVTQVAPVVQAPVVQAPVQAAAQPAYYPAQAAQPVVPAPMAYAAPVTHREEAAAPVAKAEKAPEAKPVAKPAARPVAMPTPVAVAAPAPKPVQMPAPKAETTNSSSDSLAAAAPAAPAKGAAKAAKGAKADGEVASATAADEEARKLLQDSL